MLTGFHFVLNRGGYEPLPHYSHACRFVRHRSLAISPCPRLAITDTRRQPRWLDEGRREATYSVSDGVITGTTGPGKNTFLTRGPFADFELEFEVKCDPGLNSGVQIRSHLYEKATPQESNPKRVREKGEMYGYQCEIRADVNGENGCAGTSGMKADARSGWTSR